MLGIEPQHQEIPMADTPDNYEKVSIYPLEPDVLEQLLSTQIECVFNWSTKDGWPMGVIMSSFWHDGHMWLTAGGNRHRISAIRRDPRCSVVVTSTGSALGGGKSVTIKGRAIIHEDRKTKDWFYPAFASHLNPDPEGADPCAWSSRSCPRSSSATTPSRCFCMARDSSTRVSWARRRIPIPCA
jgi:hypothetical protein